MKIFEVFNSAVPIKKTYSNRSTCLYEFEIDGNVYQFAALDERKAGNVKIEYSDDDPKAGKIWEVSFALKGKDNPGNLEYLKTGTGNAFKVFATFNECVKKFIKSHPKVEEINFEGDMSEPSRIKIYDRPKFLRVPGWTYTPGQEEHGVHGEHYSSKKYHLTKDKK